MNAPDDSLEYPDDLHIIVKEAFGEKRNRAGRRRLLLYVETEKSITQIDPMYPATMPIMNEGLYPVTLPKIAELNLRLMRYKKKYDLCGGWNNYSGIMAKNSHKLKNRIEIRHKNTGLSEKSDHEIAIKGFSIPKIHLAKIVNGTACEKHFNETNKSFKVNCGRLGCECCGNNVAWGMAESIQENLVGYREAYSNEGFEFPMYDHVVFSVPPELYQHYYEMIQSNATYPKLKKEMRKIIKKGGVKASAEFFHPYRFKHADGTTCEEKECEKKHDIQFAPHWHLLCIGFLKQSDAFYKDTGWVYKKIQKDLSPRKIKVVAHYLITHCGLLVGKESGKIRHNVVTYSGMIAPSKIRVVHKKEFIREECDICAGPKRYFVADIPLEGMPLTIEHVRRWEGPVEYWGDRRYFYLPQTLRSMKDYKNFCDHG